MDQDHYLFLEPDQSVYVVTKCKEGYEVFRMYVDKARGTCSAFVENISEVEAAKLTSAGDSIVEGYRKRKASSRAELVEK